MNLKEYFEFTETTKSYSNLVEYDYLTHGIWSEIGEFEGILAKRLRGDDKYKDDDYYFYSLKSELGDILWFLVRLRYIKDRKLSYLEHDYMILTTIEDRTKKLKKDLTDELFDFCLIDIGFICYLLNTTIEEVMEANVNKLTERKKTNTIKGSGESVNERFSLGK